MSLEALNERVKTDLSYLAYGGADWVRPLEHPEGHVYDVVIVGGGQSGLGAAFGLLRERISNILVIDENKEGLEGPWETYARMVTLRTPKHLTSIDLGIPSLTFRAWWEAQSGPGAWEAVDKIPRGDWMNYLRWYRSVLNLPVINEVTLKLIEPGGNGIHRLHIAGAGAPSEVLLARKVVLATGIQGGGEWHVPEMIAASLPERLYAHTSQAIDFAALAGRRIAILGGGASAFDNANYVLSEGAAEAHVFVRREQLPSINPIRQMEQSGMIERFHTLADEDKYGVISHFFKYNQPPTNDTFARAAAWPGFRLHLGSPWLKVEAAGDQALVTTPKEEFAFDFLIVSTGLLSDPALRPELRLIERHIARWSDRYQAPPETANPLLDAHPYLSPGFALQSRDKAGEEQLHGLFVFNYSALASNGLSASAISGMRNAIPKLVAGVADQLFTDDREAVLQAFYEYDVAEFTGEWQPAGMKS
ncbi:NAD(P)-binding domain-containing protein [Paenibacillus typhae]|uniref:Predicted flavoprotein CzcO associated with the cation diffusion facilitator CzcD n=1 Tax=Paenibacillus typhae TaxID=1174501 RepID=A0A1G8TCH8_9BACL|nr:NAD(P)/FAD-dependent oxidoreductase [Paenibacillus typhae]SDJ39077.1 Predicted flavoprotein CzcO associated with the cation diffusion facilitator CzcD [Paenibacillus typhae]